MPLYELETKQVFVAELKQLLRSQIEVVEVDARINEELAQVEAAIREGIMHRGK